MVILTLKIFDVKHLANAAIHFNSCLANTLDYYSLCWTGEQFILNELNPYVAG